MAPSLKHKFTTAKSNGTDTSLLRPSNWNDEHDLTLAVDNLLGRASAGTGAAEEIPCTAAARTVLAASTMAAICAALGVTPDQPGDFRLTLSADAPTGWVPCNDGTIGNAGSGASTRANADCQNLFNVLWNNVDTPFAPLFTSSGAATTRTAQGSKEAAWAAGCRMSLTKMLGRALAVAGSGAGISFQNIGATAGSETVTLTAAQLPPHNHFGTTGSMNRNQSHSHGLSGAVNANAGNFNNSGGGGGSFSATSSTNVTINNTDTDHEHGFETDGGNGLNGSSHNNLQPSTYLNVMVKL